MININISNPVKTKILWITTIVFILLTNIYMYAGETENNHKAELSSKSILSIMERVADWQIEHPSKYPLTDWTQGAYDNGMMALAGISGNPKYINSMLEAGNSTDWRLGPRLYMADDHCVGQMYIELYFRYRENKMIDSVRHRFDEILLHPPKVKSLDFSQPGDEKLDLWSWCDALYMGPPTWIRLYAATGDQSYLNFAVKNWWRTTKYLYDKKEHLFFRDSRYFTKREQNGAKIFWSRGNGWVIAGLARMLQFLPDNNPNRDRFIRQFKQMADKLITLQQRDSLWHSSLLDSENYPLKESSGSGLITYALAWGVNQGLLDRKKFEPAVLKAWGALVNCVDADGMLTHVQQIGGDPQKFNPNSTEVYGTGAFLLAGSEVYRMNVLEQKRWIKVKVTNPSGFMRNCETVELNLSKVASMLNLNPDSGSFAVMDGVSSRVLDSQTYASNPEQPKDKLLFQAELASKASRYFYILDASTLAEIPKPVIKTFARFVPERYDDFAWESDRIAFRMYGQKLMTAPDEPLTSSGIDVWIKSNRKLIVNDLYASGKFHIDDGPAMDDYRVGTSRGDGGLGVWYDGKLLVSKNYHHWKIITVGPVRSVFELTFDAWDAGGGRTVSEVKRISIDAGSWMSKDESIFESNEKTPLTIGVGLAERSCGPGGKEEIAQNKKEGWLTYWQPEDKPKGRMGIAVLLPEGSVDMFTNDAPNLPDSVIHAVVPQPIVEGAPPIRSLLAITKVKIGKPFSYYFGACWNRSGDFTSSEQWEKYVRRFAERRNNPLKVSFVQK